VCDGPSSPALRRLSQYGAEVVALVKFLQSPTLVARPQDAHILVVPALYGLYGVREVRKERCSA
jgi:hypothetical protein